MADEGGEKTEMPTPKKLRDARNKGQVCTSKDIVSTALLIVLMYLTAALCGALMHELEELFAFLGRSFEYSTSDAIKQVGKLVLIIVLKYSFVFVLIAAVVAIIANVAQIGFLFAGEALKPNLSKLNPAEGMKKIFSMKNLFEFLKNCAKILFLGYLIYKLIATSYQALLPLCYGTIRDVYDVLKIIMIRLAGYTAFGYIAIAIVDRIFQQHNFTKQMMMTKDEVKREYKEMEGSQEVKQAQRQFRDEILNGPDPVQATKQADVVVTNPTRLAVGLRYRPEEAPLPRVVVKGAGSIAALIRRTAMEAEIPLMENVPLARQLYAKMKIDEFIPVDLAEPVAEVLKWVKELNEAKKEQDELDSIEL